MNEMDEIRRQIDDVDDKIISALNERFELARRMREYKRANGVPRVDEKREREIYDKVVSRTPASDRDTAYGVYEKILGGSRGVIETIARGVSVREGKVLLCRAKGASSTYLPGGHIEFGETGRDALVREIREELGVEAKAGDFLGVLENDFMQNGRRHCEVNLVYRLDLADQSAVSREKWISFEWCPVDELEKANLLPVSARSLCR